MKNTAATVALFELLNALVGTLAQRMDVNAIDKHDLVTQLDAAAGSVGLTRSNGKWVSAEGSNNPEPA
jgi:hypothetical protein